MHGRIMLPCGSVLSATFEGRFTQCAHECCTQRTAPMTTPIMCIHTIHWQWILSPYMPRHAGFNLRLVDLRTQSIH
jgi:hypothetical protein